MPVFELDTPNGTFEVEAPDMQTALSAVGGGDRFSDAFGGATKPELAKPLQEAVTRENDPGILGAIGLGLGQAAFGLGDEFAAGVKTGFGTLGDYGAEHKKQEQLVKNAQAAHPWLSMGTEVAGSVIPAMGLAKSGATLIGRTAGMGLPAKMGAGAVEGGLYGAAYGAGKAEPGSRGEGAAYGAGAGAVTGGVLPAALAGGRAVLKPAADAIKARINPAGYAAQKVAERVPNVEQASNRVARAASEGDSMALADVGGEGARKLLRTVANTPGTGQNRVVAQSNLRAMAQGDRLKSLVDRTLASPDGYQSAKAVVMDARSSGATPHYQEAYATPVPFTFKLEEVLNTPAGKAGLAAAKQNSANRREPWAQWFASIDDAGNILDRRRVPDTRALDEVKRVLDGMVEAAKRPADGSPFGKALGTPQSDAIDTVRNDLVRFLTTHNKPYAKALEVAGDNIGADKALEFGRKALTMDPRVIAQKMGSATAFGRDKVLSDGDKELARIGVAEAIRKKIDDAGFTHNGLLKFFSTREQVARLRPFFPSDEAWKTFRNSAMNEARKAKTYAAVRGNSTTAAQLNDMAEAAQLGEGAISVGKDIASGKPIQALMNATVRGLRRLGGFTPEVADQVGRMLMSREPKQVMGILGQLKKIEAAKASAEQKGAMVRALVTNFTASNEGRAVAPQPSRLQMAQ